LELAALFAAVGVRASVRQRRLHVLARGPAVQRLLLLVAIGFPAAAWRVIRARTTAVHRPLLATELEGIEGLAEVLGGCWATLSCGSTAGTPKRRRT
jgi:hypothetical protein